jgi:hypothetical protein
MENPEPIQPNTIVEPQPMTTPVHQPGTVVLSTAEYDALKIQAAAAQTPPMMQATPFVDSEVQKKNKTTKEIIGLVFALLFVASLIIPSFSGFSWSIAIVGIITVVAFFSKSAKSTEPTSPVMTVFKVIATVGIVVAIGPIIFFVFIAAIFSASGSRGS